MILPSAETLISEFNSTASKLAESFEAFKKIEEVQVGTAPKHLVWKRDKVELFRYTRDNEPTIRIPVLIVYALVNRPHMLDIQEDRSFVRRLLDAGLDLYLIDWGYPSPEDKYFTMDEYINGYINDAVDAIRKDSGQERITMMGVCQGGVFSVIYSALHPEKVKHLITLVTPIDFSTPRDLLAKWAKFVDVDALVDHHGIVPGELINVGYSMLKPMLKTDEYLAMLHATDREAKLLNFLRMEQWIADSPGQAGECFRQLKDLYQQNKLIKGSLQLGNRTVNLADIDMPLLNIYAEEDHVVPPEASIPLNDLVSSKDKTLTRFAGGHIGVFVGSRSQLELAPGIAAWLKERGADA